MRCLLSQEVLVGDPPVSTWEHGEGAELQLEDLNKGLEN